MALTRNKHTHTRGTLEGLELARSDFHDSGSEDDYDECSWSGDESDSFDENHSSFGYDTPDQQLEIGNVLKKRTRENKTEYLVQMAWSGIRDWFSAAQLEELSGGQEAIIEFEHPASLTKKTKFTTHKKKREQLPVCVTRTVRYVSRAPKRDKNRPRGFAYPVYNAPPAYVPPVYVPPPIPQIPPANALPYCFRYQTAYIEPPKTYYCLGNLALCGEPKVKEIAISPTNQESDPAKENNTISPTSKDEDQDIPTQRDLATAIQKGDLAEVKLLIARGARINHLFGYLGESGRYPLGFAASLGNAPMVEFLLNSGASIDARDGSSNSVFDLARGRKLRQLFLVLTCPKNFFQNFAWFYLLGRYSNSDAVSYILRTFVTVYMRDSTIRLVKKGRDMFIFEEPFRWKEIK